MTMQGQKENECADDKVEKLRRLILPADETSMEQARAHWVTVGKPLFSLGKLEDAVIRWRESSGAQTIRWRKKHW